MRGDSFLLLTTCCASERLDYVDAWGSTGFGVRLVLGEGKLGARSFLRRSFLRLIFALGFFPARSFPAGFSLLGLFPVVFYPLSFTTTFLCPLEFSSSFFKQGNQLN